MTVLEDRRVQGSEVRVQQKSPRPSSDLNPEPRTPNPRRSRFAVYFARKGWIHALLLLGVWLFLFPIFWMIATSVKTDEELTYSTVVPELVHFRPESPYVRRTEDAIKPSDVPGNRWTQMLPRLSEIAATAIASYQKSQPPQQTFGSFDEAEHRQAATSYLVGSAVAKIDKRLWSKADEELISNFKSQITDPLIKAALNETLARIELFNFQIRTLDLHLYDLTAGKDFASTWQIESGPGKLFENGESTLLSYRFDSSSSPPVVLRHDFTLPPGVSPENLHKLILSTGSDNSWHGVNVTFDVAGRRWASDETNYFAQYRPMSFLFQPPTFDDELMRAKVWTTIKNVGPSPVGVQASACMSSDPNSDMPAKAGTPTGIPATLRVIITPSSTLKANVAKALRNYIRAFKSVPFWKYITNSMLLVILSTAGALFSASFVAYAFARLNWPGRSVAFMILLATMMLPSQVTMIPGFMIWRAVHWYNTLNPLWVPSFFGSAFFIFLMTQHMRTIPKELEEAARIDGLNAVQSWYYIILPNVKPVLAAIAILSFIGAWNEFMGPLIYLRDQAKFPLSLGLYGIGLMRTEPGSDFSWSVVMAGNMLMTLPVIGVFFLFQRYFVQGMTMTGMKG